MLDALIASLALAVVCAQLEQSRKQQAGPRLLTVPLARIRRTQRLQVLPAINVKLVIT